MAVSLISVAIVIFIVLRSLEENVVYFLSFNLPSATTPFPSENKFGTKPL